MDAKKLRQKKGSKPKLTLKLGEILKLVARYEEMTIIQKRGYPDADVRMNETLSEEEKNLLSLYMDKKTEVIFQSISDTIGQDVEKEGKSELACNLQLMNDSYESVVRHISTECTVTFGNHLYRVPLLIDGVPTGGRMIELLNIPSKGILLGKIKSIDGKYFELKKINPEKK